MVIATDAVIGSYVAIGDHVVIEAGVVIGDGAVIGNHVTIGPGARLGAGVRVSDFALVGKMPALSKRSTAKREPLDGVVIGDETSIGSHTMLMAGTIVGTRLHRRRRRWCARAVCDRGRQCRRPSSDRRERHHDRCARRRSSPAPTSPRTCTLEDDVFIAPMVVTTNDNYMGRTEKRHDEIAGCTIRRGARVGGGAHILPGVEIGEEAFVATAAVVTGMCRRARSSWAFRPRSIRTVADEELLENQ